MTSSLKQRVHDVLGKPKAHDRFALLTGYFLAGIIVVSVIQGMLDTVDQFSRSFGWISFRIELITMVIFTTEYLLRIWSCTVEEEFKHPIKGRIRYASRPLMLIDLLVILPFFLQFYFAADLRFLRLFRLFRIFRLFKLARYMDAFNIMSRVVASRKEQLVMTVFGLLVLLIISSSLMYQVENSSQPETFSSVPAALWWGAVTLTTVGYGDIHPITPMGKVLGAMISFIGIGVFALPAGMLASGFAEEIERKKEGKQKCPHCGKEVD